MRRIFATALASFALLGTSVSQSSAATYNWSFVCADGDVCSGAGSLMTNVPIGPALITSITGFMGGSAITSLIAPGGFATNDNIINSGSPELTLSGLSFNTADSYLWNIYYSDSFSSDTVIRQLSASQGGLALGTFSVSPSVPPVPIPAALPLLASALGLFGFFGWRRRKAVAA